jgi:hypothetical protein
MGKAKVVMLRKRGNGAAASRARRAPEEADSLEGKVVRIAMAGKLAKAGRNAIRLQRERGLAVTFKRGEQVIKKYPDGHEEVLTIIDRPTYTLPKGVAILRGK